MSLHVPDRRGSRLPLAGAVLILMAIAGISCAADESADRVSGNQAETGGALSFDLPAAGGGTVTLDQLTAQGDVVVVFYRGYF